MNTQMAERIKPFSFAKNCLQNRRTRRPSHYPTHAASFLTLQTPNYRLETSNPIRLLLSGTRQSRLAGEVETNSVDRTDFAGAGGKQTEVA